MKIKDKIWQQRFKPKAYDIKAKIQVVVDLLGESGFTLEANEMLHL